MARVGIPPTARPSHGGARAALGALTLALVLGAAGCAGSVTDDAAPVVEGQSVPVPTESADTDAGSDATTSLKAEPEPLVAATPDEHSEVGELVEGFPIDLLPVPADAAILVTSAVPVGEADVQEVSLNLRTTATAAELLSLYREALTSAGFTEVTPQQVSTDLAVETTFTRSGGDELVSIGVLDDDGARTVTIGGRVRTEG